MSAALARVLLGQAVTLSHESWTFDGTSRVLSVGAAAWDNKGDVFESLPAELVGADFWPGVGYRTCPPGALRFTAPSDGVVFAWHEDRYDLGGSVHRLDDDPASTWVIFDTGSLSWSPWGRSAVTYARPAVAGVVVEIVVDGAWAGGVALSSNTSIGVQAIDVSLTGNMTDYDSAPRKIRRGYPLRQGDYMLWEGHGDTDTYTRIGPVLEDAFLWPSPGWRRFAASSLFLETGSAGTVVLLSDIWGCSPVLVGGQGWEWFGPVPPTAFYIHARYALAGSRVEIPKNEGGSVGRFCAGVAFRRGWNVFDHLNKTADILAEAEGQGSVVASLTHPDQEWGAPPPTNIWEVGSHVFADDHADRIFSLTEQLVGAISFMPTRYMSYGPYATLSLRPAVNGTILAWYPIGGVGRPGNQKHDVDRLDDDPASGSALVGTVRFYGPNVVTLFVYGKRVAAGSIEPWTLSGLWLGGLAFSTNDSLSALEFPFSFTSSKAMPVVYEAGATRQVFRWSALLPAPVHSFLQGAYYFPEMYLQRDAHFHTNVSGTMILFMTEGRARNNFAQFQGPGWWFLGYAAQFFGDNFYAFGTLLPVGMSTHISVAERVCWAFSSNFDIATTTATTTGSLAYWTHDFWYIEQSAVLEAGVDAVTSRFYEFDVVPSEMAGILIWPSLELHYVDQLGSLQLTTVVSGALFVWARADGLEHGATYLLDDDPSAGWAYFGMGLHSSRAGPFVTYARNVEAGVVVDIPFVAPWWGSVGFGNATTASPQQLPVSLKHTAWSFDDIPRTLDAGKRAWFDAQITYSSVPTVIQGGWFWPGLGQTACPIGSLIVAPSIDGEVYAWGRDDINGGGIDMLDDVPANGWTGHPSTVSTSDGASYGVFRKVVPAWCQAEIPITTAWTGGVAFKQIAALPVGVATCSTTSSTSSTSSTLSTSSSTSTTTTSSISATATSSAIAIAATPLDGEALTVSMRAKSTPPWEEKGALPGLLVCVIILIGVCIAACILRRRCGRATEHSSRQGVHVRQIASGMFAKPTTTE